MMMYKVKYFEKKVSPTQFKRLDISLYSRGEKEMTAETQAY